MEIYIFPYLPGRGRPIEYHFVYDSPDFTTTVNPPVPPAQFTTAFVSADTWYTGWALRSSLDWSIDQEPAGKITCPDMGGSFTIDRYTVIDPERTKHPTVVATALGDPCPFGQRRGLATDGSGILLDLDAGIFLKNGNQPGEDTNGNQNTVSLSGTITDTLNRTPLVVTDGPTVTYTTPLGKTVNGPQYETWTYTDSSGSSQSWRVDYTAVDFMDLCGSLPHCGNGAFPRVVPTKLTLPNAQFYQFSWQNNSLGELTRIDLPTGGYISYTYQLAHQENPDSSNASITDTRMAVASRTVGHDGTTATWSYSNPDFGTVTVTDPLGNDEVHVYSVVNGPGGDVSYSTYEKEVQYWQGSSSMGNGGTLLRKIDNLYAADDDPTHGGHNANVRCIQQDTTLDNGLVSRVQTDYETFPATYQGTPYTATYMNPIAKREYAYGAGAPGALLRTTSYSYLHTGNQAYINANIVDRILLKTVSDGSGNVLQMTTNEYDNYSHPGLPLLASGAVQHDSARGTSYILRGNLTAVKRWRNTDGALLTTINQYDDAGNIVATQDPNGNITHFDFSDSWANASCAPAGQGKAYETAITDALGHITKKSYDSCSGLVGSVTDENSQTTTTNYDLFGRVTQSNYPDGGQTTITYNDSPPNPTVTTTRLIDNRVTPNVVETTIAVMDGLGRTMQTQLPTDPDGEDFTDTTYDGLGRVLTQSNPHRAGSSPTDGITINTYDALGRVRTITKPDGSVASNNYVGNCTTVTDEAGKARESCTDALGRLTQVFEDPSGLNYETDYSYDVLGNLTQVVQKGGDSNSANWRVRNFSYDSLSRLLSATNPESGTITYTYDADGNVLSKTAPAPNQQGSATVTTSYTYDVLNRLTQKSYSDGVTSTVKYGYDGAYIQCTNGFGAGGSEFSVNTIGRMNAVCNGSSARMTGYDVMGRVYFDDRSVNSRLGWADAQYGYYVGGEPLVILYPQWDQQHKEPEFELWWDVNGAGNIDQVGTQYHYFLNEGKFDPAGGLVSGVIGGNGNGLARITNSYNNRLQPVNMAVTSTANGTTLFSKTYDFHLGAGDNGNVFAVANNKDNNRSQNFTYDSLNRIQAAYTTGPNWGEAYTIDPWGNLTNRDAIPGKTMLESLSAAPATVQNQLPGYTYDAAGNLRFDGNNSYTYDAENRLIQVNGAAGTWTYVYDGDGERVEKCAGTSCGTTGTIYWRSALDGATLGESDLNVNFQNAYVLLNGKPIGRLDNPSDSAVYYLDDHLGSTSVILDSSANIVSESDYYPYGGEIPIITGDTNHYKFTGKERDSETGLDNFGARYYGSTMGRFMTPDWAVRPTAVPYVVFGDPQSLNLYGYVRNDPVSRVDADGHSTIKYDGDKHQITFYSKSGKKIGSWHANNRTEHKAKLRSGIPNGTYKFEDKVSPHHHSGKDKKGIPLDSPKGSFGSDGIFRLEPFSVGNAEHDGVGVHSGKEGVPDASSEHGEGPDHVTDGCIRTTDAAMNQITQTAKTDPLETLEVTNNGAATMEKECRNAPGTCLPDKRQPKSSNPITK